MEILEEQIQIAMVDNHLLFMEGVKSMLENTNVNVVGAADSRRGLERLLNSRKIDIILLDLNLEHEDGFDIVTFLREKGFNQSVIILTMYDSQRILDKVKSAGVEGYVRKNTTKSNLITAIEIVANGGTYFDPVLKAQRYSSPSINYSDDFIKKNNLSRREYEVLILLAKSYSTKEIADLLYISEQTVSTYRKYIKSKLKLRSIADIVRFVFVNGLI